MTGQEFLDEIIEYDRQRYSLIEAVQEVVREIFRVFHRLCMENGIPYYYSDGSLLGAYRDGGFIPWDCDIDVSIPFEEAERLLACLKSSLPEGYYFVSDRTDADFPYYQIRICKKGYDHHVHVDVFYLFGLPDGSGKKESVFQRMHLLFDLRWKKAEWRELKGFSPRTLVKKALDRLIPQKALDRAMYRLCSAFPFRSARYACEINGNAKCSPKNIFDTDMFGEPRLFLLGDTELLVPQKIEAYLTRHYGNWREYMPIRERYEEFESNCEALARSFAPPDAAPRPRPDIP